jgi:hypothetical protein
LAEYGEPLKQVPYILRTKIKFGRFYYLDSLILMARWALPQASLALFHAIIDIASAIAAAIKASVASVRAAEAFT